MGRTTSGSLSGDIKRATDYVKRYGSVNKPTDYASTSASIQNLLLSLHSENLGCKWATGPIIQTRAFRNLIGCDKNDMIVGLIMIGLPKRLPRMRRRRREIDGDVLRDVEP